MDHLHKPKCDGTVLVDSLLDEISAVLEKVSARIGLWDACQTLLGEDLLANHKDVTERVAVDTFIVFKCRLDTLKEGRIDRDEQSGKNGLVQGAGGVEIGRRLLGRHD